MIVTPKKEDVLIEILKLIAPGTHLREGLDSILEARTGALIVISDAEEVLDLVDGGFNMNEEYTPAKLYELAKMDGAIVLSKDVKKILIANAQLIPSSSISTKETGTRHKTAERVAKETKELVICISQRRNVITIFKGNFRYIIEDTSKILTKSNQALQTLEKYKKVFDDKVSILNEYEFNNIVTLDNVITSIQRAEMTSKIAEEVERGIYELGDDGRLVKLQLEELMNGFEEEKLLIIKDYMVNKRGGKRKAEKVFDEIRALTYEDLGDSVFVSKMLGYEGFDKFEDVLVSSKGFRIISKIPRMPNNIVENLIKEFKYFQNVLAATIEELDAVDGIGEVRARTIKQSLKRMQEQFIFDNLII